MKSGNKVIKPSDIIFTAVLVAAAVCVWALVSFSGGGSTVVLRQDGKVVAELPLSEDTVFTVEGDYINEFTIENGSVRVTHTTCPNHQCERTGAVSAEGAGIACAPNRVSATVAGEGGADAVTG